MRNRSTLAALIGLVLATGAAPALARPGGWGGGGWGGPGWGAPGWDGPGWGGARPAPRSLERDRSHEGRIQVNRFVGDDASALGHGAIAVAASQTEGQDYVPQGNRAPFEAAVVDQLVHAGYDTTHPAPQGGQLAELTVTRTVVQDAEARHKPVSGEMAMSVGNRGTAYGMALNVDLTKPLPPLVSTKLEARIRDRASGKVLWEGRAEVATREGDKDWGEQDIAARLAEALFDGFPTASDARTGSKWGG
jgi:hypothetical protein